ncbi:hypothetical protein P8452_73470 [Trifolium repens]|nr:hypothetical protein P8452_73470 [Trifolium repens]
MPGIRSQQLKKNFHFHKSSRFSIPSLLSSLEFFAFPSLTRSIFPFPSSHQTYHNFILISLSLSQGVFFVEFIVCDVAMWIELEY